MLKRETRYLTEAGHELVGGDFYAKLMFAYLDTIKSEIARKGPLIWCFDAEENLRRSGLFIVSVRPSFDCSKAHSSAETAICANPTLAVHDRILASLYRYKISQADGIGASNLRADQRQWLRFRESCGSDTKCLDSAYDLRIRILAPQ